VPTLEEALGKAVHLPERIKPEQHLGSSLSFVPLR
jgi:hypothetical protein